jgi:hypothetical protein
MRVATIAAFILITLCSTFYAAIPQTISYHDLCLQTPYNNKVLSAK